MGQFHSFACPVFPWPFIEETVLSPLDIFGSFVVNVCIVLFLGSVFYSIDLCVCFHANTILFDYCNLV